MVRNDIVFPVVHHAFSLQLIFKACVLLIVYIHPGVVTEVTHLVPAAFLGERLAGHAHLELRGVRLVLRPVKIVLALGQVAFVVEIVFLPVDESLDNDVRLGIFTELRTYQMTLV